LTISSTTRKAGPFTGTGATVAFPFTFKVFAASDVLAVQALTSTGVETVKVLTTDYTVALNADQNATPGGTLTMLVAPPAGTTLTLTSQVPLLQGTDLTNAGGFYPKVINDALDRLTILIQQVAASVGRALTLSLSAPAGVSTTLPNPVGNALLGWNTLGTAIQNFAGTASTAVSLFMAGVVAAADAATARTLLGAQVAGSYAASGANADITALNGLPVSGQGVVLPGDILTWGGSTVRPGCLACPTAPTDISRTTYAALFNALGTTWGAGNGTTTFGMPYFPAGYGPIQTNGSLGTASVGLIQDHSHPITIPNGASSVGGAVNGQPGSTGAVQLVTGTNFPAGMRVQFCVKY
jgi:Phage Tail Collar Domain